MQEIYAIRESAPGNQPFLEIRVSALRTYEKCWTAREAMREKNKANPRIDVCSEIQPE